MSDTKNDVLKVRAQNIDMDLIMVKRRMERLLSQQRRLLAAKTNIKEDLATNG